MVSVKKVKKGGIMSKVQEKNSDKNYNNILTLKFWVEKKIKKFGLKM